MQVQQHVTEEQGWLYRQVQTLGSFSHTSTPAYILSGLFLISSPKGFASPAQAAAEAVARMEHDRKLAEVIKSVRRKNSSKPPSDFMARLVANNAIKQAERSVPSTMRAIPPFWQLACMSGAYAVGGYIIGQNDVLNGSGVVSAISIFYLIFRTTPTLRQLPRSPLALTMSLAVLTLGFGVHGSYYFDRASWRGAVPMFTEYGGRPQPKYNWNSGTSGVSFPTNQVAPPIEAASNNDRAREAAFLRRQDQIVRL